MTLYLRPHDARSRMRVWTKQEMSQFVRRNNAQNGSFAYTTAVVQRQTSIVKNIAELATTVLAEEGHPIGIGGPCQGLVLDMQDDFARLVRRPAALQVRLGFVPQFLHTMITPPRS